MRKRGEGSFPNLVVPDRVENEGKAYSSAEEAVQYYEGGCPITWVMGLRPKFRDIVNTYIIYQNRDWKKIWEERNEEREDIES